MLSSDRRRPIRVVLCTRCAPVSTSTVRFAAGSCGSYGLQKANARPLPKPAWLAGFGLLERRGGDLNSRGTEPPLTVFETAAFDRSATPPDGQGYRGVEAEKEGFEPSRQGFPH